MKKNKTTPKIILIIVITTLVSLLGCQKQEEWLDVKSSKSAVVPKTLADFQAMLDDDNFLNNVYSFTGSLSADNFYLTAASFNSAQEPIRNYYTWEKDLFGSGGSLDWNNYFRIIEVANAVLDGLEKIKDKGTNFDSIKGQAHFHRAIAYFELTKLFCKPYSTTASTDLGLPLRMTSDVNVIVQRANLSDTFKQITTDATTACKLLPTTHPYLQRAISPAAYALLASVYLTMGEYTLAAQNATECLKLRPDLLDFNDQSLVSLDATYRFPINGKKNLEILFFTQANAPLELSPATYGTGIITSELYALYETDDLRKTYFYAGSGSNIKFRGNYTGGLRLFCGLATNEVYLIRSECNARLNKLDDAISDLNFLLKHRYVTGTYTDLIASDISDVLSKIIAERRKELPFTGNRRWEDLRRLNKEIQFQKTISRSLNGVVYTLLANSNRYTFPIANDEILLSGIIQNER